MPAPRCTQEEFVRLWEQLKSPMLVARELRLPVRKVYERRANLAKRGIVLETIEAGPGRKAEYAGPSVQFARRRRMQIDDGTVIAFSDAHWLPDHDSTGQDALETLIRELKPKAVICGGDVLDGTQIGRWDPTRGHHKPADMREQLECLAGHMADIRKLAKKADLAWTLGNHDLRLSRYVAVQAEHLLPLPFTRLEDWCPGWPLSWTVEINTGAAGMLIVRHRNQPGMLHLQGSKAGCNYAHGHLHRLNVHTQATFLGYRYSVDMGSLADPESDVLDYAEGAPNHCQGFAVFTFRKGRLMMPELCYVQDGKAWFRGEAVA